MGNNGSPKSVIVVGKRLAQLRRSKFLSQEQLAVEAGVSARSIGRVEQAESAGIYLRQVPKFAAAFGLSEVEFLEKVGAVQAPPLTGKLEVVLPPELLDQVAREAEKRDLPVPECVAALVGERVKQLRPQPPPPGGARTLLRKKK